MDACLQCQVCSIKEIGNSTVPSLFLGGTIPTSRQPTISGYQNITFNGIILILCSTNITCDYTFVTFVPLFFLTFDGTTLTLCSTNIICDCTFVTFGGSFIFFPYI